MTYRSLTVFAIKQRSTGFYLPTAQSGQKGGTWAEPTEGAPPKLFKRAHHAHGFLTVWLRGGQLSSRLVPQSHRDRDDMEVVALALVEHKDFA